MKLLIASIVISIPFSIIFGMVLYSVLAAWL